MAKRLFTSPIKSNIPSKMWSSPSVRSPKITSASPSKSSMYLVGYIVQIGLSKKSKQGNSMFDVIIKVEKEEFKTVKVMEATKNSTARTQFQQHRGKSVKVSVSKTPDNTLFFNEGRGAPDTIEEVKYSLDFDNTTPITELGSDFPSGQLQFILGSCKWVEEERIVKNNYRVRKCLIKDTTGESLLSFWNNNIDEVSENNWYLISAIDQTTFFGDELSCSRSSILELREETTGVIDWGNLEDFVGKKVSTTEQTTTLCCPDIISVTIHTNLHCPMCNAVRPEGKIVKCATCGKKSLSKHAEKKLQGEVNLKKQELMITLVFNKAFLEKKYPEAEYDDEEQLGEIEDTMLLMENVDFVYDGIKMEVIDIKQHAEEEEEEEEEEGEEGE